MKFLLKCGFAAAFLAVIGAAQVSAQDISNLRQQINSGTVGVLAARSDSAFTRLADDLGIALDKAANEEQLRVLTILGRGSLKNIEDLLLLRGIDIAFTQSDVLAFYKRINAFPNIENVVQYITKVHDEEFHLLSRSETTSVEQLEGKKVNFGREGTGTFLSSSVVFDELGINVEATTYPHKKALELLKAGEIDAMAKVDGKPVGVVAAASLDDGIHLVSIPIEPLSDNYVQAELTHEDYPTLLARDDKVKTVAVSSLMAVYNWTATNERSEKVDRFIRSLFANLDELRSENGGYDPKWREVDFASDVPGWTRHRLAADLLATQ